MSKSDINQKLNKPVRQGIVKRKKHKRINPVVRNTLWVVAVVLIVSIVVIASEWLFRGDNNIPGGSETYTTETVVDVPVGPEGEVILDDIVYDDEIVYYDDPTPVTGEYILETRPIKTGGVVCVYYDPEGEMIETVEVTDASDCVSIEDYKKAIELN